MRNNRFKVATFNLFNLAMPGTLFYRNEGYTESLYQRKRAWISEQLRSLDGDLVGFQEVFEEQALRDVLSESGLYEDAEVIVGERKGSSPSVALVSRYPVIEHCSIPDFPICAQVGLQSASVKVSQFSRPVVCARVEIRPGLCVHVYVVHLKSKNPLLGEEADLHAPMQRAIGKAKSLVLRSCEATALRCLMLQTMAGNDDPVIVMGDINDTETAVTSEIITGTPPWRNLKHKQKQEIWDTLLYSVKDIQARQSSRNTYYTHIHNGHYESLDHVLVSQEFIRQNPQHIGVVEYVSVLNDHLVDETLSDEKIPRWQSDHGQVVATIRLSRSPRDGEE